MEVGVKLGRYEIRKKIGAGGMGEVFLAHDTELDRAVALKVLPTEFCCDAERMSRFKQEARAASALNHPHIITIYEIGEADGRAFIATEYIDGETLKEKIKRDDLSILDAVRIGEQVASALATAHEAHIIHRDIKPENIMIRRDGYAKILDFGLAKATAAHETASEDKTLKRVQTQAGLVMGSVRYMSPEQARGKEVDERTDVWSLGVVMYEMLTGKNPFDGETVSDSLAAVIHIEPEPIENFVENVPEDLQWIIHRMLRKKADERYQKINDVALDLADLRRNLEFSENDTQRHKVSNSTKHFKPFDTGENETLIHKTNSSDFQRAYKTESLNAAATTGKRRRQTWVLPMMIVGLASALAFGAWLYQPFAKVEEPNFSSPEITRISDAANVYAPMISPDGKNIVYVNSENGAKSLSVRQVATGSTIQIVPPATNIGYFPPVFSPDGSSVYYVQIDTGVGTLYQIATGGGTPKKLIHDIDTKIALSPDGKRLAFMRNNAETGLQTIILANSDGSGENPFLTSTELEIKGIYEIGWSPDNENLLVVGVEDVFGDEIVKSKLQLVSLNDKSIRPFGERSWLNVNSLNWTKNGSLLMIAKATEQEPAQIWMVSYPDGADSRRITNDTNGYATMSLARDAGAIVGTKQDIISALWSLNPQTKEFTQLSAENKNFLGGGGLMVLPDHRLLVSKTNGSKVGLFSLNENGKDEKALVNDDSSNYQAVRTPDGRYIVFASLRNRQNGIWRIDADGKNQMRLTDPDNSFDSKPQVLPDNRTVVFERRQGKGGKSTLMKVSIDGGEAVPLFTENAMLEMFPRVSPDGKRFVYTTMNYDRDRVRFIKLLRMMSVEGGAVTKLEKEFDVNIGWNYKFTPDGKHLTYVNTQGAQNLYNFPIDGSQPKPLTNFNSGIILNFDWSPDGKRLYIVRGIVNNELVLLKDTAKV